MTRTIDFDLGRFRPSRDTLLWAGLLVNTELVVTIAYLLLADVQVDEFRYLVYPFVWLNVSVWALVRTNPVARSTRARYLGGALAVGYFLVLAYAGGIVGFGSHHALGWRVAWLPPGWGPALTYAGETVTLALMPYNLVGYAALAYLVYATVLDAAGSAISGALGLLSCVSCTWPVLATVFTGVAGAGSAVATAANEWSYALGTVVFVLTVGLLYWRPTVGK
ncbi:DUF7546 family protein [Halorussus amylolyticus]|uniref:DUF7546 family protein n=1 Tax=Halorussus amylolyticus TaxID=1126242 RepID=UPI0010480650|nr:hypothetical protein [Halorussus amylolyticus]